MTDMDQMEQKILDYWKEHDIHRKANLKNKDGPKWFFVDGPPYATGQIHPGTAFNKCLKDCIVRYRRASGYRVNDRAGYDTHGLAIEVRVEQELKITNKNQIEQIGVAEFIQKCKSFATKYIDVISGQFMRCGVWLDFEKPYITYKDEYIESIWRTIKAASDKGLLVEGEYVVPQCVRCQTGLANYELEYEDQDDPSLYVKFKVKGTENEYLVIWTTTPWTLVANMGVMAHPTHTYVKVKVGAESWIVAKERLDAMMAFAPLVSPIVLGEMSGKKLEGMSYEHPLAGKIRHDYARKVVLSDEYVTLDDGSGLVHCAPGHGPEDFIIGRRFSIPLFCPVDGSGKYTAEAGDYAGREAKASNKDIIADLEAAGALIHAGKIRHRYPHCWRCKTPLIFIATHQWFIAVSKTKERMLEEIDRTVTFHPDFAKTRFRDFVASAPDWCISRQRYWGTPLPIWACEKCKEKKIISSRAELPRPVKELHRPYIDEITYPCACGAVMRRVPDILDVWFDSGNAVWAQLVKGDDWAREGGQLQADFVTEGKDQTRGWFYSMLGSGVVLNNESPYRALLMHGFFVDEKGEKMSKSLGNFVSLEEMVGKHGADTFRLWGLSNTTWDDLKFSWRELEENHRVLDIMLNVAMWMDKFCVPSEKAVDDKELEFEDRWLRSRTQDVIEKATHALDDYEPHTGLVALRDFMVEDISRFYLKRLKSRMNEGRSVAAGMATLYETMRTCIQLLAPYCPFVSEHIYLSVFRKHSPEESVSLLGWPKARSAWREPLVEQQMAHARQIINAAANARSKASIKLRWPVEEVRVSTESTEVTSALVRASTLIESMANVRKVAAGAPRSSHEVEFNSTKIGAKFKADSPKVLALLRDLKIAEIVEGLGKPEWKLEGKYGIDADMVSVTEKAAGFSIAGFDNGRVYVKSVIDAGLYAEAMERELARRIQMMRKDMGLEHADRILVRMAGDSELLKVAKQNAESIAKSVNAESVRVDGDGADGDLTKEWDIEDMKVKISIRKAEQKA